MEDTEREREAETQVEGEAGSMQGARRGTRSRVSRIMPWAEGSTKPLSHPGCLEAHFHKCLVWRDIRIGLTYYRDPWVAQRFGACLWPRARSWRPGIESHVGLLVHGAGFSLYLCLCLSLSVSLVNK